MKNPSNNKLVNDLYNTHTNNIITRKDKKYLNLFEHYNDLVSNIEDEDLRNRILYSHIRIEEFLFDYIFHISKTFYRFGFNDLKGLLFKD